MASAPIQSFANFTFTPPNNSDKCFTICFKEYFSVGPSLGRPRWLIKITLPPSFNILEMVGMVARIRLSSVISNASFKGTLKSTLIKAFLPAKEKFLNKPILPYFILLAKYFTVRTNWLT